VSKEDLMLGQGTRKITLGDDREVTVSEILLPEYAVDTGTTDAYALTIPALATPYTDGTVIWFKAATANTGACTLNVNSSGAKDIRKHKSLALADNDIVAGMILAVVYDGTNGYFQMLHHGGNILVDDIANQTYAADAEASDAYVITLTPAPSAYVAGMQVSFKANTANTGACTLNVNSLGAKDIVKGASSALETGDILSGQTVIVVYDGTNFSLSNKEPNVVLEDRANTFTSAQVFSGNLTASSGIDSSGGAIFIKTKVLEIGDWDMDTAASVNVAHGLTHTNIRRITALIRNDDDSFFRMLDNDDSAAIAISSNSTNIILSREASGAFDG